MRIKVIMHQSMRIPRGPPGNPPDLSGKVLITHPEDFDMIFFDSDIIHSINMPLGWRLRGNSDNEMSGEDADSDSPF